MMLPGLVSVAFYRRRPSPPQLALGLAFTVGASAALGFVLPGGPLGRLGSVLVAVASAVALYFGIFAYLSTRYGTKSR